MIKYIYVPMPLNANGDGPEMDDDLVVRTRHEVWDTNFLYIMSFNTEEQARSAADRLNQDE